MPQEHEQRELTPREWVAGFEERYLADYVPSGGSVVRFVGGDGPALADVRADLQRIAAERNFHYRFLDASAIQPDGKAPRFHWIERLYSAITDGVDWQAWARLQAEQILEQLGVHVPPGGEIGDVEGIAAANGMDRNYLLQQYSREAQRAVQDHAMTVEFRSAVTNLWVDQLMPDTSTPGRSEVLTAWLNGRPAPPGGPRVLKGCQIYGRIASANARHYLVSFCEWTRRTGKAGVAVALDFRAYEWPGGTAQSAAVLSAIEGAVVRGEGLDAVRALLDASKAEAPSVRYSNGAYMQMLSLLRRFIDEIDRLPALALIVLTSPQFYGPKLLPRERRYVDYNALQTRIGEEVGDRRRANPDAALVHLRRDAA